MRQPEREPAGFLSKSKTQKLQRLFVQGAAAHASVRKFSNASKSAGTKSETISTVNRLRTQHLLCSQKNS